jgi:hypothetical protein
LKSVVRWRSFGPVGKRSVGPVCNLKSTAYLKVIRARLQFEVGGLVGFAGTVGKAASAI